MVREVFNNDSIEDLFSAEIDAIRGANGDSDELFKGVDETITRRTSAFAAGSSIPQIVIEEGGSSLDYVVERSIRKGLRLVHQNLAPALSEDASE